MTNFINVGPPAEPVIVRAICDHLLKAYDEFINNFDGKVDYLDGFMAAHNFHVMVIEHLVEETGVEDLRVMASSTFERRMMNPDRQDTKVGPDQDEEG